MAGEDEEVPWYRQPMEAQAPQAEAPPQAVGQSADERAVSDYLSPGEGRPSLVGMLGAPGVDMNMSSPGAGTGSAGGMGALMLPMLLAQMQQRQQVSPLGAFANAYSAATGRPSPVQQPQGMSQYQQFEAINALVKNQALEQDRQSRQSVAQEAQRRLAARDEDTKARAVEKTVRDNAIFQVAEGKRQLGAGQGPLGEAGASNIIEGYKKLGINVGPDEDATFQQLATGNLTHKTLNELAKDMELGMPDEILKTYPGVTDQVLNAMRVPNGPVARLAIENRVKLQTDQAKLKQEEFKVIQERFPELKGEGAKYFVQAAREEGKTVMDGSDDDARRWNRRATLLQNADVLNLEAQKSKITQQREISVAGARSAMDLARHKELLNFQWANTPATISGQIYMKPDGQTATVQEMQQPERVLAQQGFFRARPEEMKQVNQIQSLKAMIEDTGAAAKKVDDLGGFGATRAGWYGKVPILGPLAEEMATKTELQRMTTRNPKLAEALAVFEQKKSNLVAFGRNQGDMLRALGANLPDMNVIETARGYPQFQQVLGDISKEMRAAVSKSRTPGAWDAEPTALPSVQTRLSAQAQQMYDNAAARLQMRGLPPDQLQQELDNLRRKLMMQGGP